MTNDVSNDNQRSMFFMFRCVYLTSFIIYGLLLASCGSDSLFSLNSSDKPVDAVVPVTPEPNNPQTPQDCRLQVAPNALFNSPRRLSDLTRGAVAPDSAVRGDTVVAAWHGFTVQDDAPATTQIYYVVIVNGCVSEILTITLPDAFTQPKRPSVIATASGFVISFYAVDANSVRQVFAQWLNERGEPVGQVVAISALDASAYQVDMSSQGDTVAFTWSDGKQIHFAIQGGVQDERDTIISQVHLISEGPMNYPVAALAQDGTLFIAYYDGGVTAGQWDIQLLVRPPGGVFEAPTTLLVSPNRLSNNVSLRVRNSGLLEIVWVEQVAGGMPDTTDSFEVGYMLRATDGTFTPFTFFTQDPHNCWFPSLALGLSGVWVVGARPLGQLLYTSDPNLPPVAIVNNVQHRAGNPSFSVGATGNEHIIYMADTDPRQIYYGWRSIAE